MLHRLTWMQFMDEQAYTASNANWLQLVLGEQGCYTKSMSGMFHEAHICACTGNGKGEANGSGAVHAVLYGAIGSSCLQQFHAVLAEAAEQPGAGTAASFAGRVPVPSICLQLQALPCASGPDTSNEALQEEFTNE